VTNSSTKLRSTIQDMCKKFYDLELPESHIFTSNYLAAQYLKNCHPEVKRAYICGSEPIKYELDQVGISSDQNLHNSKEYLLKTMGDLIKIPSDVKKNESENGKYDAVVFGIDQESTLYKLNYASYLVQNGALF